MTDSFIGTPGGIRTFKTVNPLGEFAFRANARLGKQGKHKQPLAIYAYGRRTESSTKNQ
jgi:hypothetical protein